MYLQLITMLDRSDQEPLDEKGNSFLYCGVPRETNNDYLKALGLPVRSTCTPATPYHSPCSLTSSALLCRPLSFAALSVTPHPHSLSFPFPVASSSILSLQDNVFSTTGLFSRIVSSWIITTPVTHFIGLILAQPAFFGWTNMIRYRTDNMCYLGTHQFGTFVLWSNFRHFCSYLIVSRN